MNDYLALVVACGAFVFFAALVSDFLGLPWLVPTSVVIMLCMMFAITLRIRKGKER